MSLNWEEETARRRPSDAAPVGLRDSKSDPFRSDHQGTSPWLQPGWQTGGNARGVTNAFNDDFYTRMYNQYEEEQRKIDRDPGYVSNLFLRNDFTGIVGWNQSFAQDDPVFNVNRETLDRTNDATFRVGDIYDNGRFLGNVYDDDTLTLAEKNAMVAPHVFGQRAADKYAEADGDQEKLRRLIEAQGQEEGRKVEAYATRAPYQKSVDALLEDWDNSVLDEVLLTAAGVVGGAVAGIVGGPWGMVAGGILGGAGALANKDETLRQAAQAVVSTGLVGRDESAPLR